MTIQDTTSPLFIYLHEIFDAGKARSYHTCAALVPNTTIDAPLYVNFMNNKWFSDLRTSRFVSFALAYPISREGFGAVRDFLSLAPALGICAPYYFSQTMSIAPDQEIQGLTAIDPFGVFSPSDPNAEARYLCSADPFDPDYMSSVEDSFSDGIRRARMNCVTATRLAGKIAGIDETRIHPRMPDVTRLKTMVDLFNQVSNAHIISEDFLLSPDSSCVLVTARRHDPGDGGPPFATLRCTSPSNAVVSDKSMIQMARNALNLSLF